MHKALIWTAGMPAVLFTAAVFAQDRAAPAAATHGSWSVECVDQGKRCVATQKVSTDAAGQKTVLGVLIEPADAKHDKGPMLSFRFTNQAYRPAGAGMKIDQREPLRAPISSCDDKVCEVRAWLTPELVKHMSNGKLLIFAYFLDSKQQVSLPVSLNGFGKALEQVNKSQAPARK